MLFLSFYKIDYISSIKLVIVKILVFNFDTHCFYGHGLHIANQKAYTFIIILYI